MVGLTGVWAFNGGKLLPVVHVLAINQTLNNKLRYHRNGTRCQLLLITNRKSHSGIRLVLTSMTLDDLERRSSLYFAFFSPISISLLAKYVAVVEYRLMLSVNIVSQFQSSIFTHN